MNFCRSKHFFNYSTILLLIILFEEILAVDDICISGTSKVTNDLLHEGMNTMKFLAKLLNKKPYTLNEVVSYIKDKKININQDLSTIMYDKEIITALNFQENLSCIMVENIEDKLCTHVMRICNIKSETKDSIAIYGNIANELTVVISLSEQTQRTYEIKVKLFSPEENDDPVYIYENISVEDKVKLDLIVLFLKSVELLQCNVVKKSDLGNHIYHFLVFTINKTWNSRFILEPLQEGKYKLTSKIQVTEDAKPKLSDLINRISAVQL